MRTPSTDASALAGCATFQTLKPQASPIPLQDETTAYWRCWDTRKQSTRCNAAGGRLSAGSQQSIGFQRHAHHVLMGFASIPAERREKCQRVLNAAQIRRRECVLMQMAQHPAIVLMCDTISNIRPECFSFSLPLLQFQKRFLATSANKAFVINRPVRFLPLLRPDLGELEKPYTKKWTRLSPCPICTSNLLIFIQS